MKKFFYLFSSIFLAPVITLAATTGGEPPVSPTVINPNPTTGPTTIKDWFEIVQQVVGWLFTFAIIVGVAVLIIAGIVYITSAGGDRAKTAGKWIIYAVVGIAIAALAWAITNLVGNFFVGKNIVR